MNIHVSVKILEIIFGYFELRSVSGAIVITKASMHKSMRKPNPLTNIEEDHKVDDDLVKRLAKAFEVLQDLEE
jgi:hypothetical protein